MTQGKQENKKFTDVSEVLAASIIRAIITQQTPLKRR
jgi:hypothetical protein